MFQFRQFNEIPPVIRNLLLANGVFFLAQNVFPWFNDLFALHFYTSPLYKPWQIITHMFMHGGFSHLFFNMLMLWMFGSILEQVWGSKRFLIFYFFSGIAATLLHTIVIAITYYKNVALLGPNELQIIKDVIVGKKDIYVTIYGQIIYDILSTKTLGASGAIYGVMAAFAYLFPNTILNIYMIFPIKAKYAMGGMILLEFILGTTNIAGDNVAHFAHLGGALMGLILVYYWNKTNRKTLY